MSKTETGYYGYTFFIRSLIAPLPSLPNHHHTHTPTHKQPPYPAVRINVLTLNGGDRHTEARRELSHKKGQSRVEECAYL